MSLSTMKPEQLVRALQAFDALPSVPQVSIELMATAPGNEHLLRLLMEPTSDPMLLAGKRVGILATHGAEEVEFTIPKKWLRDRGATVDLISPRYVEAPAVIGASVPEIAKTHILLIQFMKNSGWVPIDRYLDEVRVADYDAIIIPGGAWNPDQLRVDQAVLSFLKEFQATGKVLAAICHGPIVLVSAKLLAKRRATAVWNIREDLANAGAIVVDEPVAVDENIVTGRFIFDIPQFLEAIVAQLVSANASDHR